MLKNIMRNTLIAAILITLAACSSKDENNTASRNNPGMRRLQTMQKELDLTDAQMKEVEKIFQDSRDKFMQIRDQAQGDRSKMREMMFEMRKENDKKIEALLTDEQKEKFEEYKAERDERMKNRMNRRGGMQ